MAKLHAVPVGLHDVLSGKRSFRTYVNQGGRIESSQLGVTATGEYVALRNIPASAFLVARFSNNDEDAYFGAVHPDQNVTEIAFCAGEDGERVSLLYSIREILGGEGLISMDAKRKIREGTVVEQGNAKAPKVDGEVTVPRSEPVVVDDEDTMNDRIFAKAADNYPVMNTVGSVESEDALVSIPFPPLDLRTLTGLDTLPMHTNAKKKSADSADDSSDELEKDAAGEYIPDENVKPPSYTGFLSMKELDTFLGKMRVAGGSPKVDGAALYTKFELDEGARGMEEEVKKEITDALVEYYVVLSGIAENKNKRANVSDDETAAGTAKMKDIDNTAKTLSIRYDKLSSELTEFVRAAVGVEIAQERDAVQGGTRDSRMALAAAEMRRQDGMFDLLESVIDDLIDKSRMATKKAKLEANRLTVDNNRLRAHSARDGESVYNLFSYRGTNTDFRNTAKLARKYVQENEISKLLDPEVDSIWGFYWDKTNNAPSNGAIFATVTNEFLHRVSRDEKYMAWKKKILVFDVNQVDQEYPGNLFKHAGLHEGLFRGSDYETLVIRNRYTDHFFKFRANPGMIIPESRVAFTDRMSVYLSRKENYIAAKKGIVTNAADEIYRREKHLMVAKWESLVENFQYSREYGKLFKFDNFQTTTNAHGARYFDKGDLLYLEQKSTVKQNALGSNGTNTGDTRNGEGRESADIRTVPDDEKSLLRDLCLKVVKGAFSEDRPTVGQTDAIIGLIVYYNYIRGTETPYFTEFRIRDDYVLNAYSLFVCETLLETITAEMNSPGVSRISPSNLLYPFYNWASVVMTELKTLGNLQARYDRDESEDRDAVTRAELILVAKEQLLHEGFRQLSDVVATLIFSTEVELSVPRNADTENSNYAETHSLCLGIPYIKERERVPSPLKGDPRGETLYNSRVGSASLDPKYIIEYDLSDLDHRILISMESPLAKSLLLYPSSATQDKSLVRKPSPMEKIFVSPGYLVQVKHLVKYLISESSGNLDLHITLPLDKKTVDGLPALSTFIGELVKKKVRLRKIFISASPSTNLVDTEFILLSDDDDDYGDYSNSDAMEIDDSNAYDTSIPFRFSLDRITVDNIMSLSREVFYSDPSLQNDTEHVELFAFELFALRVKEDTTQKFHKSVVLPLRVADEREQMDVSIVSADEVRAQTAGNSLLVPVKLFNQHPSMRIVELKVKTIWTRYEMSNITHLVLPDEIFYVGKPGKRKYYQNYKRPNKEVPDVLSVITATIERAIKRHDDTMLGILLALPNLRVLVAHYGKALLSLKSPNLRYLCPPKPRLFDADLFAATVSNVNRDTGKKIDNDALRRQFHVFMLEALNSGEDETDELLVFQIPDAENLEVLGLYDSLGEGRATSVGTLPTIPDNRLLDAMLSGDIPVSYEKMAGIVPGEILNSSMKSLHTILVSARERVRSADRLQYLLSFLSKPQVAQHSRIEVLSPVQITDGVGYVSDIDAIVPVFRTVFNEEKLEREYDKFSHIERQYFKNPSAVLNADTRDRPKIANKYINESMVRKEFQKTRSDIRAAKLWNMGLAYPEYLSVMADIMTDGNLKDMSVYATHYLFEWVIEFAGNNIELFHVRAPVSDTRTIPQVTFKLFSRPLYDLRIAQGEVLEMLGTTIDLVSESDLDSKYRSNKLLIPEVSDESEDAIRSKFSGIGIAPFRPMKVPNTARNNKILKAILYLIEGCVAVSDSNVEISNRTSLQDLKGDEIPDTLLVEYLDDILRLTLELARALRIINYRGKLKDEYESTPTKKTLFSWTCAILHHMTRVLQSYDLGIGPVPGQATLTELDMYAEDGDTDRDLLIKIYRAYGVFIYPFAINRFIPRPATMDVEDFKRILTSITYILPSVTFGTPYLSAGDKGDPLIQIFMETTVGVKTPSLNKFKVGGQTLIKPLADLFEKEFVVPGNKMSSPSIGLPPAKVSMKIPLTDKRRIPPYNLLSEWNAMNGTAYLTMNKIVRDYLLAVLRWMPTHIYGKFESSGKVDEFMFDYMKFFYYLQYYVNKVDVKPDAIIYMLDVIEYYLSWDGIESSPLVCFPHDKTLLNKVLSRGKNSREGDEGESDTESLDKEDSNSRINYEDATKKQRILHSLYRMAPILQARMSKNTRSLLYLKTRDTGKFTLPVPQTDFTLPYVTRPKKRSTTTSKGRKKRAVSAKGKRRDHVVLSKSKKSLFDNIMKMILITDEKSSPPDLPPLT